MAEIYITLLFVFITIRGLEIISKDKYYYSIYVISNYYTNKLKSIFKNNFSHFICFNNYITKW